MANYFDNQNSWYWSVSGDKVTVTTDHGNHTHTLDVTDTSIGEMADNTGKVMGDAHRAASHDFKDENEIQSAETLDAAQPGVTEESGPSVQDDGILEGEGCDEGPDGGEDCDDGLDV